MKKKIYAVALTGGIGSGKTTVADILRGLGYRVFDCDKIYSEALNDGAVVREISKIVGVKYIVRDGAEQLDRKAVSAAVFGDANKLGRLNAYTHPLVMKRLFEQIERCAGGLVFAEVPLLFENGFERMFDYVIVVMRSRNERIKSAALRDGRDEQSVLDRIKFQFDYENFDGMGHTLIYNDSSLDELSVRVETAVESIKEKINKIL